MTQLRGILWLAVFAAAFLLLPWHAAAQSAPVTDDTFGQASTPSEKEGAEPFLVVRGSGSNTYLRFDLSVLPTGVTSANVSKAMLRLFVSGVTSPGNFDVFLVNGPWNEKTLTFNNAPPLGTLVTGGVSVAGSAGRSYLLVDVTRAVTAWLSGTPNNGLALVPSKNSTLSVLLDSKESFFTSHDPELEVEAASFGPQGPAVSAAPAPGCSSSTVGQTFDAFMHGCAGTVSFANRASVCSADTHTCTAAEWNAHRGSTAPAQNYWTGDNPLNFVGGPTNNCSVSVLAGTNSCTGGAMLVCPNGGGSCVITGCGLDTTTPQFFGGCALPSSSSASGTLCCGVLKRRRFATITELERELLRDFERGPALP